MAQEPREVDPPPAAVPVGADEQLAARPVAPGGLRRVVTGVAVGVVAGLLLLQDLRDADTSAGRVGRRVRGWSPRRAGAVRTGPRGLVRWWSRR